MNVALPNSLQHARHWKEQSWPLETTNTEHFAKSSATPPSTQGPTATGVSLFPTTSEVKRPIQPEFGDILSCGCSTDCFRSTCGRTMKGMSIRSGGEQGDAMMPLLFCLGQQEGLQAVQRQLLAEERLFACFDDVCVVTRPERVTGFWRKF